MTDAVNFKRRFLTILISDSDKGDKKIVFIRTLFIFEFGMTKVKSSFNFPSWGKFKKLSRRFAQIDRYTDSLDLVCKNQLYQREI